MFRGYLYVPTQGSPVLAYAEVLATTAIPRVVTVNKLNDPDTTPGLYHARIMDDERIARGARVKGGTITEIHKLAAAARSKTQGRVITQREATKARTARALADALRSYVLPRATPRAAVGV